MIRVIYWLQITDSCRCLCSRSTVPPINKTWAITNAVRYVTTRSDLPTFVWYSSGRNNPRLGCDNTEPTRVIKHTVFRFDVISSYLISCRMHPPSVPPLHTPLSHHYFYLTSCWWGRNKEVLLRVNEQRDTLHEIRKRKANWIGHILRRNCLLKQVIEGKIEGEIKWQEDEEEDVGSYWMTLGTG